MTRTARIPGQDGRSSRCGSARVLGAGSAVFLYVMPEPLTKDQVQPFLCAMSEVMDVMLPDAMPRVMDVRKGRYFDIDRRCKP